MENNFPKYLIIFLILVYFISCVAEILAVKNGVEAVFESVRTFVPHITMFMLGLYFSRK